MSEDKQLVAPNGTKKIETPVPTETAVTPVPAPVTPAAPIIDITPAPISRLPRVNFDAAEYRGQTSTLITVVLSRPPENECRVNFVAKELSNRDRIIETRELVIQSTQDAVSFSLDVAPNFSRVDRICRLELSQPTNAELGEPHVARFIVEPTQGVIGFGRSLSESILSNPNTSRVARHLMLVILLIGGVFLLDKLVASYADSHQKDWSVYLNPTEKPGLAFPPPDAPRTTSSALPVFADYEQTRISDQLKRIRAKQNFHLSLMEFFYKGYYMGIIILSFTGALAAISLLLISKKGWAATSEYVITTFFIMTCAALFYGSWAGLFKQEENITNNKVLYLRYTALENELFSYVATGEALKYDVTSEDLKEQANAAAEASTSPSPGAKSKTPANQPKAQQTETKVDPEKSIGIRIPPSVFIHYVDLQLAQDNIAIGFDYSQIPNYKNAFSNIGNVK